MSKENNNYNELKNSNQAIYNGKPSIVLKHRPFFSIIIPCYNSRKTIGNLLDSIVEQHMDDDIEVIISDDCSTENYQDIVQKYLKILSIKQIQTDYNFAPGNTREKGVSIAEGEWICFADHDDVFIMDTLKEIKRNIIESKEKYYVIANFYEQNPDTGEIIREVIGYRNWNHAKFYNLDNFWKPYNIHFKKDLLTHEDICISSQVNCAIKNVNDDNPLYVNIFCYMWNNRPTTISREKYGNHSFLEVFLKDYITATAEVYIDKYLSGEIDFNYAFHSCMEVLLYCYFYMQGIKFHNPSDWIKDNETHCRNILISIKSTFSINENLTNMDIFNYAAQDDAELFSQIRPVAIMGCGPFIETETFLQWLNILHVDIVPRITMTDAMRKQI